MSDAQTLRDVIAQVEKAEGADASVDEAIYRVLGYWWDSGEGEWCAPDSPRAAEGQEVPAYTSRRGAAVSLVPEGWRWSVDTLHAAGPLAVCDPARGPYVRGEAATPALALCAAALKARKADMEASDDR